MVAVPPALKRLAYMVALFVMCEGLVWAADATDHSFCRRKFPAFLTRSSVACKFIRGFSESAEMGQISAIAGVLGLVNFAL